MRVGILTISDRSSRGEREDRSGPEIARFVSAQGWSVDVSEVTSDDLGGIQQLLSEWADADKIDVILTTGGTGFSPRDHTPEATLAVCDRLAPGLAEAMRAASLNNTPHAMLSRAIAGIRGRTIIINLPGNPKAVIENLQVIAITLPHAVALLRGDPKAGASHSAANSGKNA